MAQKPSCECRKCALCKARERKRLSRIERPIYKDAFDEALSRSELDDYLSNPLKTFQLYFGTPPKCGRVAPHKPLS